MTASRYGKELAEMMTLWNCGEREAVQMFLQSIYIAEGNRPETAAAFINTLPDDELVRSFDVVISVFRREASTIELLALKPTRT